MFKDNPSVRQILEPRINPALLKGYYGGVLNSENDKLHAATLVALSKVDYNQFQYFHSQFNGHSASHYQFERSKKYITPDTFQYKSIEECITEGIYKHFSVSFTGIYFEGEWFILKSLHFYGDLITKQGIIEKIEDQTKDPTFWQQSLFLPAAPFILSDKPDTVIRVVTDEEFAHAAQLVALIKQQKKEKINHLYRAYLDEAFIVPFFEQLKIKYPEKYQKTVELRGNYTSIFPAHKSYTLFCCMAQSANKEWTLHYFIWDDRVRRFYKWTYFKPAIHTSCSFYSDLIINDLKQITYWDTESFLDSSCTLDDDNFWDNYVFKSSDTGYLYLEDT